MAKSQSLINDFKRFFHRRKALLFLCPILVLGLSYGAAKWLPKEYKSSITIMVEQDETLNPMVRYNMAVALASEDRLKSFNEIIYSRPTINMLIDSLGIAKQTEKERDRLIKDVRANIQTQLKASDSFTIIYYAKDPKDAKKGVKLLSDHFIETKLKLKNKRNNRTVEFFQKKLDDLKQTVEQRQKELTSRIQQDVQSTPRQDKSLQKDLQDTKEKLNSIEVKIQDTQNKLETVQSVISGKADVSRLYNLDLSSMSGGERIQTLLGDYQQASDNYTEEYPKVKKLRQKVYAAAETIQSSLQDQLFQQQAQKSYLQNQSQQVSKQIQQSTMAQRKTNQSQQNIDVYRTLYDEMKVKLEQAKTTRDLGEGSKNQFVVIEPPVVPDEAAKPNKMMLMGGGLGLGLFLGLLVAAVAELLDTTIRRPRDIKEFNKPVIAYISKGD